MPLFNYKAQGDGGVIEGVMEEADRESVVRRLIQQGKRPLSVVSGKQASSPALKISLPWLKRSKKSAKLTGKDIEFFTKELALLVKGGMSLDKALRLISRQSEKEAVSSFAHRVERELKEGSSLSTALLKEPAFSDMYASIVRAGEEGGVLPEMLTNIAEYQAQSRELKQFIIASSIYPVILLTMGVAILLILVTVILPRFQTLFEGMEQELPMNVALLMQFANFCSNNFLLALVLIVAPPLGLVFYARSEAGKEQMDKWLLKFPPSAAFIRDVETTRIFRTMEVLVKNGVQFVTALRICGGVAVNRRYKELLGQATTALKEGARVAPKLKGGLFPGLAVDLLAIGEESGRIGEICGQIARHFEQELRERLKRFVALLEPIFILVMAVGAGYIVLSMLTVILSMNDIAG